MPVINLEIKSRMPYAGGQSFGEVGAYEQVDGMVHFGVDPDSLANETIEHRPPISTAEHHLSEPFRMRHHAKHSSLCV